MPTLRSPLQNRLLAEVMYESGSPQQYAYLPTKGIISMLCVLKDGSSAEIAVVGNEGLLGIALFMGGETTRSRAIVQSAGSTYRIKANLLTAEFDRNGPVLHLLLRYTQSLITQMTQTAVCNRHHFIEQHLCRWLLLSLDRLPSDSQTMTQDLIANMLGARREGIVQAAGSPQRRGLIRYTVLDRPALDLAVRECYAVVESEFDRVISDIHPGDPRMCWVTPLLQPSVPARYSIKRRESNG